MNTCKYCGAKIGNFFLKHEIIPEVIWDEYLPTINIEVLLPKTIVEVVREASWDIITDR